VYEKGGPYGIYQLDPESKVEMACQRILFKDLS
jgi:hypothetical protein